MPRYPENRTTSLYVTGFSEATRPILLTKLFERHGPVADVYMPKDWQTHQHRGFAYVVFENGEDAQSAVESTESFVLDGQVLSVQFARASKREGPQMKGPRQEQPMDNPNQLPEHTRRPGNAPFANSRKHSRNASQSPVRRTRCHSLATLPPCRRHDRHCCLHIKRESTPSSCSPSCSCSRSPSPVCKTSVPDTCVSQPQYVYAGTQTHGSRCHRRRHRSEETSVSLEPDAPMPTPKREDSKRSGSVRNGSVQKDEISLSVDDCDW